MRPPPTFPSSLSPPLCFLITRKRLWVFPSSSQYPSLRNLTKPLGESVFSPVPLFDTYMLRFPHWWIPFAGMHSSILLHERTPVTMVVQMPPPLCPQFWSRFHTLIPFRFFFFFVLTQKELFPLMVVIPPPFIFLPLNSASNNPAFCVDTDQAILQL